jgi:hypothetical protein
MNESEQKHTLLESNVCYQSYTINFEQKTLDDLKKMREGFKMTNVRGEHHDIAYLIRMIDLLLEKVERLENE